jgi:hypothetical protein
MKTYLKNKKERIFLADSELNPSNVTFFETNNADLQNNFRFIDLGAKPTLLNASGNTNFIFRIDGLEAEKIDEINAIDSSCNYAFRNSQIPLSFGKRLRQLVLLHQLTIKACDFC